MVRALWLGGAGLRGRRNREGAWSGGKRKLGHEKSLSISPNSHSSCKDPK